MTKAELNQGRDALQLHPGVGGQEGDPKKPKTKAELNQAREALELHQGGGSWDRDPKQPKSNAELNQAKKEQLSHTKETADGPIYFLCIIYNV